MNRELPPSWTKPSPPMRVTLIQPGAKLPSWWHPIRRWRRTRQLRRLRGSGMWL